jgi:catechol 2,3-dioxygenase-like lactoylglutathione lyase family enzyme
VLNPTDAQNIDLLKRDNEANNFVGPGPYGVGAARLWNVPVVETDALSAGTALVGDFSKAVLFDRLSLSVTLGTIHDQNGHGARRDPRRLRRYPPCCVREGISGVRQHCAGPRAHAGAVFVNGKNPRSPTLRGMTISRMDHAGVVVEDLAAAIAFFVELGLELEGEAAVEGEWVDQLVGLDGVRADIAVVRTPDGHGRVELSTFHTPVATSIAPRAPMNTPGIPRLTFVVDAVDDVLDRLRAHGAELVGEVAQYGDIYRYCYVRGPDGIIIGLVEELR